MKRNQNLNKLMDECRTMIWNAAEDQIISTRIAPFGFDETKLTALKEQYNSTIQMVNEAKTEHAEWRTTSENFKNTQETARNTFNKIRQSLKFWYDANSSEANELGLYNQKISRYADFIQSAKAFYTKVSAMSAVMEKRAPFGFTAEKVTQLLNEIEQLDQLKLDREKESGDAQYATKARNLQLDELYEQVDEIRRLAKLIFEDDEAQYLEKLGIITR